VPPLVELRHAEVELALEGGHADQERAGEAGVDDLLEPGVAGEVLATGAGRLDLEDPDAEDREARAAEEQQVGGAPERHVLPEQPVPDVVHGERQQRHGAADEDHHRPERHPQLARDLQRDVARLALRERHRDDPAEEDAEQAGEDEVVRRVGERALVAPLGYVQGDVPVHAEDGDEQAAADEGGGEGGPAGQPGLALGDARELADPLDLPGTVRPHDPQEARRHDRSARGRDDHLVDGRAAGGLGGG
jgi:hypothetical protein